MQSTGTMTNTQMHAAWLKHYNDRNILVYSATDKGYSEADWAQVWRLLCTFDRSQQIRNKVKDYISQTERIAMISWTQRNLRPPYQAGLTLEGGLEIQFIENESPPRSPIKLRGDFGELLQKLDGMARRTGWFECKIVNWSTESDMRMEHFRKKHNEKWRRLEEQDPEWATDMKAKGLDPDSLFRPSGSGS